MMDKNYSLYNSKAESVVSARKLNLHSLIFIIPLILILLIFAFFITSIRSDGFTSNLSSSQSSANFTNSTNSLENKIVVNSNSSTLLSSNKSILGVQDNKFCQNITQKVDKINSLSQNFVPDNLINLATLKTDKPIQIRSEILSDLTSLFTDAAKSGLNLQIVSGYRSYQTQISLFNSYVAQEKANGLSEADAIVKANTYSAKPGHSEHQLGTVVDVSLAGSQDPFNLTSADNLKLFNYLEQNVTRFNFSISYPKDNKLGYQYEPWHLRWISKDCKSF